MKTKLFKVGIALVLMFLSVQGIVKTYADIVAGLDRFATSRVQAKHLIQTSVVEKVVPVVEKADVSNLLK